MAAISPTLKGVQGDVKVRSMFPVAAGDQYKWPLLAVLSHAEQPNESAGERRTQEPPPAQACMPKVPGFLHLNLLHCQLLLLSLKQKPIPVLNSLLVWFHPSFFVLFLLFSCSLFQSITLPISIL